MNTLLPIIKTISFAHKDVKMDCEMTPPQIPDICPKLALEPSLLFLHYRCKNGRLLGLTPSICLPRRI